MAKSKKKKTTTDTPETAPTSMPETAPTKPKRPRRPHRECVAADCDTMTLCKEEIDNDEAYWPFREIKELPLSTWLNAIEDNGTMGNMCKGCLSSKEFQEALATEDLLA